jgi:hypothetical protein
VTEPVTRAADLQFLIDIPRYRWRLETLDGIRCLVPGERLGRARFTGDAGLLALLTGAQRRPDQELLDYANTRSGLFVKDGQQPLPEVVGAWRSESLILRALTDLRAIRARIIPETGGPGVRKHPAAAALDRTASSLFASAAAALIDSMDDLRPDYSRRRGSRNDGTSETALLAWLDATAEEHWEAEVPVARWFMAPVAHKTTHLASVAPVIRCRTPLGYAYGQLLSLLEGQSAGVEAAMASAAAKRVSPSGTGGDDGSTATAGLSQLECRRCAVQLDPVDPATGRKRRSDLRWCPDCRRSLNRDAQRRRRAAR